MQIEIEKYALWIKTLSTAYCECSFKIYTNLIRFFFFTGKISTSPIITSNKLEAKWQHWTLAESNSLHQTKVHLF